MRSVQFSIPFRPLRWPGRRSVRVFDQWPSITTNERYYDPPAPPSSSKIDPWPEVSPVTNTGEILNEVKSAFGMAFKTQGEKPPALSPIASYARSSPLGPFGQGAKAWLFVRCARKASGGPYSPVPRAKNGPFVAAVRRAVIARAIVRTIECAVPIDPTGDERTANLIAEPVSLADHADVLGQGRRASNRARLVEDRHGEGRGRKRPKNAVATIKRFIASSPLLANNRELYSDHHPNNNKPPSVQEGGFKIASWCDVAAAPSANAGYAIECQAAAATAIELLRR